MRNGILIIVFVLCTVFAGVRAEAQWNIGNVMAKTAGDSGTAAETRIRNDFASAQALPLPSFTDRTGIINVPDSLLEVFEDPGTNEESMYLRSYGAGNAAGDTIKVAARHSNLIKSTADTAYVFARTDSATALIKVVITVKDMAGNTIVSGTITPTVDATWSRAAFPLLLTLDAEEVVITYTIITVNSRYVDVTALRLKEAS